MAQVPTALVMAFSPAQVPHANNHSLQQLICDFTLLLRKASTGAK
jgi:hypothetical protein